MPRKTPDEIFKVTRIYEPDRKAEVKALQIVLNAKPTKDQEEKGA